ncbi:hypothetical protein HKBW3S42_02219, partial [Candidatus Hakubella thermalkaliphila]
TGAAIPNPFAVARGESTWGEEAMKPVTFLASPIGGGAQAAKTWRGIEAAREGGVIRDDRLKHPGAPSPGLPVLGPHRTPAAREYRREDRRPRSKKQTKQWRLEGRGEPAYDRIIFRRALDSIDRQIKEITNNQEMSQREKIAKIRVLYRRRNELAQKGYR